MPKSPPSGSPSQGFTLIELLVVLAIISILALVSLPSLGPKSPKAVRSGLQDIKASLQQARSLAIANGKPVNVRIILDSTQTKVNFRIFDTAPNGAESASPLADIRVGSDWTRYAEFTTSQAPVDEAGGSPLADLEPLKTLGFDGWSGLSPTVNNSVPLLGFSPQGYPQSVDQGTKVRTFLPTGTWIGVRGTRKNQAGLPYGGVFITGNGLIAAYYKPDAKLNTTQYQWQRLE